MHRGHYYALVVACSCELIVNAVGTDTALAELTNEVYRRVRAAYLHCFVVISLSHHAGTLCNCTDIHLSCVAF